MLNSYMCDVRCIACCSVGSSRVQRLHDAQRGERQEMFTQTSNRTDELQKVALAIQSLSSEKQKAAEERKVSGGASPVAAECCGCL